MSISYSKKQDLHIAQGEKGYESLIKANILYWRALELKQKAEKSSKIAQQRDSLLQKAHDKYVDANHRIAVYGAEKIVKALSDFYILRDAPGLCDKYELFAKDANIYHSIRNTLGLAGNVTNDQIATVVFSCRLP